MSLVYGYLSLHGIRSGSCVSRCFIIWAWGIPPANGELQPIVYISRVMTSTEQRYAQIEKEASGVTWAGEQFQDYLIGKWWKRTTNTCASSNLWMNSPLGFNVSACVWWGSAIQFLMYHGCSRHSLTNTSFPANSKGRIPTRSMCFPRLSGKQPARHWQTTVRYPVTPGQWSSLQSNQTLLPRWMATKIPSEGTPKGIHLSEGWIVCSQRPTP